MSYFDFPIPNIVSVVAPSVVGPNGQRLVDYGAPVAGQLQNELISKLRDQGNAEDFTAVDSTVAIAQRGGQLVAVSPFNFGSGVPVGNSPNTSLPSNVLPASGTDNTTSWKCTLTPQPSLGDDTVVFNVMPRISEQQSANYRATSVQQHPGEMLKYEGTSARRFGISVKLVSRTSAEADANHKIINLLRSWEMPFYGTGTAKQYQNKLGAPPPVLKLAAFGQGMIGPSSVVLTTFDWTWDPDVDWIPKSDKSPFPCVIEISLTLEETYSPAEFSSFDLSAYRTGNLTQAFGGGSNFANSPNASSTTGTPAQGVDTSQPQISPTLDSITTPSADSLLATVPTFNTDTGSGLVNSAALNSDASGNALSAFDTFGP